MKLRLQPAVRRFILRRTAGALFLLIGVTAIAFVLTNVVPGDPIASALGEDAADNPEAVAAFEERHGLNRPLPVQYGMYVSRLVQGDLGISRITRTPVRDELRERIPATLELAFVAISLSLVAGITLGTAAAMFRDRWLDQFLRVISLAGVSAPVFWLAIVALYLLHFRLGIFPGVGRLDPGMAPPPTVTGAYTIDSLLDGDLVTFRSAIGHIFLPAGVLAVYTISVLTRFSRSAVLDVLGHDYIRMARAKGIPGRVLIIQHVLRAAISPIITVGGVMFGNILSGTVLVESVFVWPGLGQYAFRSATNLDLPGIVGVSIFVGVVFVTINLIVDLLYGVIDPRIELK